ncbi:MAG: efflux RND transporter periplasmic adaptor subunit [Cyclobacteriaceae bacterium]|nr:efflux RND transporter periplasmic adaptor subunit [Cyclobacteriaceae bacterium]
MKVSKKQIAIYIGLILTGGIIGYLFSPSSDNHNHVDSSIETTHEWTCSMHPQIRQPDKGKCPICGMDLIPVGTDNKEENTSEIKMSESAMKLANIQTTIIKKRKPVKEIRLNGKVQVDERSISSQTSHITGRIEQLLVSYTGEYINKGQILAYVYSPELVTTQEELFEAYDVRQSQPELYAAAREKLKNWKLTERQIDKIIAGGKPTENFPILSDLSGVVLTKRVNLGDHIMQGESLFEVANLSKVWVLFDVYESDMSWVKKGDNIQFSFQSFPGEIMDGSISFIDPVINPKTRVTQARVSIYNPEQRLKPEMFAQGTLKSEIKNSSNVIIVPKSAVMWTGERSIVYIKNSSSTSASFNMQEVLLGPSLGDSYIIKKGLEEGDEIVVNGTFSVDAAAQLAGKSSMMSIREKSEEFKIFNIPQVEHIALKKNHPLFSEFQQLIKHYMEIKNALVNSSSSITASQAKIMRLFISKIDLKTLGNKQREYWILLTPLFQESLSSIENNLDLERQRMHFINLSNSMTAMVKSFSLANNNIIYLQHCPMANNNKGANWLSMESDIRNPYFGDIMLTCGSIEEKIK